jgi:hypothetical protein
MPIISMLSVHFRAISMQAVMLWIKRFAGAVVERRRLPTHCRLM